MAYLFDRLRVLRGIVSKFDCEILDEAGRELRAEM
jgi:hypothetical protein